MRLMMGLRAFSALVAASFVLAACGGGGHSVPVGFASGGNSGSSSGGGASTAHGNGNVAFTLKIPRATASSRLRSPATISSGTNSLAITVNGASPAQTFNIAAPACTMASPNVCTFNVGAPYGLDSFLIKTFSGLNGTGTALNAAATSLNVTQAGPNQAVATAGSILMVTSAADGGGSCGITGPASGCTLREAISEAQTDASNSGDPNYTDAIMFAPGVSNITLSSGTIALNSNIVLIGPGASAQPNPLGAGAPAAAGNLTIDGSGNQIFSNGSYAFAVSGLTLSNGGPNGESSGGGAIENYGSLSVSNTVFSGNTSSSLGSGGGAIYDEGDGNTQIVASTFTNNKSLTGYGGAYYDEDGASFISCVFSGNTAFDGSSGGEGGAIYAYEDLSVDRSVFSSNVAGSTTVSGVSWAAGGAISIEGDSTSPLVTNSTFGQSSSTGNFAGGTGTTDSGEGGAIYNDGSYPLTISGNTFSYNTAKGGSDGYGGAISDYVGMTSTNDTFSHNTADASAGTTGSGGAGGAYSEDSANNGSYVTSWTNDTFTNNTATGPYCDGGGLYVSGSSSDVIPLSDVRFTGNTCAAASSATYPETYGGALEIDSALISFSNVTFSGNTASAVGSGGYYGEAYGGGFSYYQGTAALSIARHGAQSRVKAPAIDHRVLRSSRLAHRRATTSHRLPRGSKHVAATTYRAVNRAHTKAAVTGPADGMDTVSFTNNTANAGSAGFAYGGGADLSGDITVTNTTFSSNSATASGSAANGYGGGVSYGENGCGTLTFTGTVSNNSALTQGGGLWNNCTANLTGSSISGNTVTAVANSGDGGGGMWNDGSLTLTQCTINGNSVPGNVVGTGGGGIFNYSYGTATISSSTITNNSAGYDGGGIENQGYALTVDTATTNSYSGNSPNDVGPVLK